MIMIKRNLITFNNLTLYLIESKETLTEHYITLEEALDKDLVILHDNYEGEADAPKTLTITNRSNSYIFLMAGDLCRGGYCDRALVEDFILKPQAAEVSINSIPIGFSNRNYGLECSPVFTDSKHLLCSLRMKCACRIRPYQAKLWDEICNFRDSLEQYLNKYSKGQKKWLSIVSSITDKTMQKAVRAYVRSVEPEFLVNRHAVGFVAAINGRIVSMESFGSPALFAATRHKLLESLAVEAFIESLKQWSFSHPAHVEVKQLLAATSKVSATETETDRTTLERFYESGEAFLFDTFHRRGNNLEKVHSALYRRSPVPKDDDICYPAGFFRDIAMRY
jgi:hypothetical protein